MEWLENAEKIIRWVTRASCYVGMFLLVPMMLLTAADVVGRAAWSKPIPGAVELSSYMLAVFILLGVAYTQQVKGHVRVTMLVWRLPERAAVVLDTLTTLLSMFIILILAWQGLVVGLETTRVSDMLRIAQQPFRFLVAIAGFFLFLELSIDLTDSLRKLWGKQP